MSRSRQLAIEWSLRWESPFGVHTDRYYSSKINLWRDYFPGNFVQGLMDLQQGDLYQEEFAPGELVDSYEPKWAVDFPANLFNRYFAGPIPLVPYTGRFYPRGITPGIANSFSEDRRPFRFLGQHANQSMRGDYNHPLARFPLALSATVRDVLGQANERGGRAQDLPQLIAYHGPGMQVPHVETSTDFYSGRPFGRVDETPDEHFYAKPRLVHHLDSACREQITALYQRLLKPEMQVLDLMSSWVSHLPDIAGLHVTGLGMNQEELAHNPVLERRVVQDLNQQPTLPFDDGLFDAVICTASVEYLVQPEAVFGEIVRVLKPGGVCVMTFSNRWFSPKAIQLWQELHAYERLGLVIDYFLRNLNFTALHSETLHGLPRPEDDKYANTQLYSDPLFAAWAYKR